jgi:hypothetical protein
MSSTFHHLTTLVHSLQKNNTQNSDNRGRLVSNHSTGLKPYSHWSFEKVKIGYNILIFHYLHKKSYILMSCHDAIVERSRNWC